MAKKKMNPSHHPLPPANHGSEQAYMHAREANEMNSQALKPIFVAKSMQQESTTFLYKMQRGKPIGKNYFRLHLIFGLL